MYIPKKYGQSKVNACPFCGKTAITKNSQGVPVCEKHRNEKLPDLKCACGSWLELRTGKFGAYFNCMKCGNINFKRALELNPNLEPDSKPVYKVQTKKKKSYEKKSFEKDVTVTSDELDFMY